MRTQHYTVKTLNSMLRGSGFELMKCDPVEYDWDTELPAPTEWMGDPYPFDWLAMAKKVQRL